MAENVGLFIMGDILISRKLTSWQSGVRQCLTVCLCPAVCLAFEANLHRCLQQYGKRPRAEGPYSCSAAMLPDCTGCEPEPGDLSLFGLHLLKRELHLCHSTGGFHAVCNSHSIWMLSLMTDFHKKPCLECSGGCTYKFGRPVEGSGY